MFQGKDLYGEKIKSTKEDAESILKKVNSLVGKMNRIFIFLNLIPFFAGVKPSDTGLCHPTMWDLEADKIVQKEPPMKVVRCLAIIPDKEGDPENIRYMVQAKQGNKFITNLDRLLAPVDVREGMRVG